MKRIFIFLIVLIITTYTFAQTPAWQWATQAGGSSDDIGYGITIDEAGNNYVIGLFRYIATFGPYSLTSSGWSDIFVSKMDANGNWLWATQAGGSSDDIGYGIAIDEAGNNYVTGSFKETATFGPYSLTSSGDIDIFVAKMDENGNWLWATQAGGYDLDRGNGIIIDDIGNCYVTGLFRNTATFGSYTLTSSETIDIFVAKMDMNGNWLWATQAGSSDLDVGEAITIDNAGNCYVTGYFGETATFGSHTLTSSEDSDIFVAKMDENGNWQWATQAGGSDWDVGNGIAIDDIGNCFVTGEFKETATFGPYSLISSGNYDIFVAKMDANGNWQWVTQAGGSDWDRSDGIAIDDIGNCFVTGSFYNTATFGSYSLTSSGSNDIFVAKMDENGNWLWVTQAGGSDWEKGLEITTDEMGNTFVTGYYLGTATFGYYSLTSYGYSDIFVAKILENFPPNPPTDPSPPNTSTNVTITPTLSWSCTDPESDPLTFDVYFGTSPNPPLVGSDLIQTTYDPETLIYETTYYWHIVAKDNCGNETESEIWNFTTESEIGVDELIPEIAELLQNSPNPFNPTTTISFSIPEESNIELTIFNIRGQKLKTLANKEFTKGSHSIIWNGEDELGKAVGSGVYYYKLYVNGKIEAVKKCLLLK